MIGTIGSLVQETSRKRWLLAVGIYSLACIGAAMLLGMALGFAGRLAGALLRGIGLVHAPLIQRNSWSSVTLLIVGALALLYAASDLGWIMLPRPHLRDAVPITWWRRWRPYGAAFAYGASLGLGIMTRIPFGAFYVVCALVLLCGDPLTGALVLAVYGAARALVMFPASWGVLRHCSQLVEWLQGPLFDVDRAQDLMAGALVVFASALLVSAALA